MIEYSFPPPQNTLSPEQLRIVELAKREPPEKRVAKLIELGVLTDMEGYDWGYLFGRFFVFVNVDGVPVPMYRTSKYTDGKRGDLAFFVFFGSVIRPEGQWVIKGHRERSNAFYDIKKLEDVSRMLTSIFDFDTSRKVQQENEAEGGYVPEGREVENERQLNELLSRKFDIDFLDFDRGSLMHEAWYYSETAPKILKAIEARVYNDD